MNADDRSPHDLKTDTNKQGSNAVKKSTEPTNNEKYKNQYRINSSPPPPPPPQQAVQDAAVVTVTIVVIIIAANVSPRINQGKCV